MFESLGINPGAFTMGPFASGNNNFKAEPIIIIILQELYSIFSNNVRCSTTNKVVGIKSVLTFTMQHQEQQTIIRLIYIPLLFLGT